MMKKALMFALGFGLGVLVGSNIGYEAAKLQPPSRMDGEAIG